MLCQWRRFMEISSVGEPHLLFICSELILYFRPLSMYHHQVLAKNLSKLAQNSSRAPNMMWKPLEAIPFKRSIFHQTVKPSIFSNAVTKSSESQPTSLLKVTIHCDTHSFLNRINNLLVNKWQQKTVLAASKWVILLQ